MYLVSGDTGIFTGYSMLQLGRVLEGTYEVKSNYSRNLYLYKVYTLPRNRLNNTPVIPVMDDNQQD
jgi:hypothetical protein